MSEYVHDEEPVVRFDGSHSGHRFWIVRAIEHKGPIGVINEVGKTYLVEMALMDPREFPTLEQAMAWAEGVFLGVTAQIQRQQ